MRLSVGLVLFVCCIIGIGGTASVRIADAAPTDEPKKAEEKKAPSFKTDVMPILSDACANCHGGRKKKGGVDLSSYDAVLRSVKVNEPDKSRLVKSVTGQGAKLMPPKVGLSNSQVKLIKEWIAGGAKND